MFVHCKPFLPVCPPEGLIVPELVISLADNKKFSEMYKGPTPSQTETPSTELQALIDAFLSLGVPVK